MHNSFILLTNTTAGDVAGSNVDEDNKLPEDQQSKNKKNIRDKSANYENKIKMIEQYFGVSHICAMYIFHRRRKGFPWKTKSDPKYLDWNMQLQNAIIYLDTIVGFDWENLEFGFEEIQFIKNNIDVNSMPKCPVVLKGGEKNIRNTDKDGFTKVSSKINIAKELNKMGLLLKKNIRRGSIVISDNQ